MSQPSKIALSGLCFFVLFYNGTFTLLLCVKASYVLFSTLLVSYQIKNHIFSTASYYGTEAIASSPDKGDYFAEAIGGKVDFMDNRRTNGEFADAVCIDAGKVYDSCMDKDCAENLRVYFSSCDQQKIAQAVSCRVKCAEIVDTKIDVEPVAFNRGFFSCDITFCIAIKCEVQTGSCACGQYETVTGLAQYSKRVILCGGEGTVKTFSSRAVSCDEDSDVVADTNLPRCTVQVVDPVVLDSKICKKCECPYCCGFSQRALSLVGGEVSTDAERALYVTLGIFSIVQLVRNVQMLVPVYDFCVPQKRCKQSNDTPCDIFESIEFPVNEFFPESCEDDGEHSCGCCD